MNGCEGFIVAVTLALQLHPRTGCAWLAVVCSSWVWLSRGSTGRSKYNAMGWVDSTSAAEGNKMTARAALIIVLLSCLGLAWVLEQPLLSLMPLHPALQWIQAMSNMAATDAFITWMAVDTYMGAFAAETSKPLALYTNRMWVYALARSKPMMKSAKHCITTTTSSGKLSVHGTSDTKKTQAYTQAFGQATLDAYVAHNMDDHEPPGDIDEPDVESFESEHPSAWETAMLKDVMEFIYGQC